MNIKRILVVLAVAGLSSCSTVYKIEQTPDDVYYSPAPPQNAYVQANKETDVYNNSSAEDREILRHINNRRGRRHPAGYDENLYGYIYPYGYYPYGNTYGNSYPVYLEPNIPGSLPTYTAPRKFNLGAYTKPPVPAFALDPKTGTIRTTPTTLTTVNGTPARRFSRPNNGTGVGNFIRKVISSPNTYSNNTGSDNNISNSTQSRSFEPAKTNSSSSSSRSSSSSSSSGGSSAPVRTFKK